MDNAHLEAVKVPIFSVGVKRAQNSLIPHLHKLYYPLFELLCHCGVSWHHHNKLYDFTLVFCAVTIVESWAVLVVEISCLL